MKAFHSPNFLKNASDVIQKIESSLEKIKADKNVQKELQLAILNTRELLQESTLFPLDTVPDILRAK